MRTGEATEKNTTNSTGKFNARLLWFSLINELIARDTLMNHIPKTEVHQGPMHWKWKRLWIVPKWHRLFHINRLDFSSSAFRGSQSKLGMILRTVRVWYQRTLVSAWATEVILSHLYPHMDFLSSVPAGSHLTFPSMPPPRVTPSHTTMPIPFVHQSDH